MYHKPARLGRRSHEITGRTPARQRGARAHFPSIFADEAQDSRSDRYVYVPTIEIFEGSRCESWQPFFAVQSVPRHGSRHGHAKHLLRLTRDDQIGKPDTAAVKWDKRSAMAAGCCPEGYTPYDSASCRAGCAIGVRQVMTGQAVHQPSYKRLLRAEATVGRLPSCFAPLTHCSATNTSLMRSGNPLSRIQ